jgi:uncharacterized protein YacL (UPF0231 family)
MINKEGIKINAELIKRGYYFLGQCPSCRSKPFRWKHSDGHEFKLWKNGKWQLIKTNVIRYGEEETAIKEIVEYYSEINSKSIN